MIEKKKKSKKRKKLKIHHFIILFFLLYISLIAINQNKLKKDLSVKELQVKEDIAILEEEIEELDSEIAKKGSMEFLENVAREELGMVKPNEIVYIDKDKFKNSVFDFLNKSID